jgi:hypothetical protein
MVSRRPEFAMKINERVKVLNIARNDSEFVVQRFEFLLCYFYAPILGCPRIG